ncbi:pilus assembly protein TadE, partial [Achromobacter xylosoxidans]
MMSARHRQQGQAMAEALLVLPGLALVLLAIGWLGRLQFSAQMLLQASRMTAMASAAG